MARDLDFREDKLAAAFGSLSACLRKFVEGGAKFVGVLAGATNMPPRMLSSVPHLSLSLISVAKTARGMRGDDLGEIHRGLPDVAACVVVLALGRARRAVVVRTRNEVASAAKQRWTSGSASSCSV